MKLQVQLQITYAMLLTCLSVAFLPTLQNNTIFKKIYKERSLVVRKKSYIRVDLYVDLYEL